MTVLASYAHRMMVLSAFIFTVSLPLQSAWASENCTFDPASGQYQDQHGKISFLLFGKHGFDFDKYFDLERRATREQTIALINRNQNSLVNMRMMFTRARQILNSTYTAWFGFEEEDDLLDRAGRLSGVCSEMREREAFSKEIGLFSAQIFDLLLILYDPLHVAVCKKYQDSKQNHYAAGVDNKRNPRVLELREERNKLIKRPDALQNNSKAVANLDFEYAKLEREEFAQRDIGMAQDINKELHRGPGIVFLGIDHKDGVVKKLLEICRSQVPAGRSHVKPSPKKSTK